MPTTPVKELAMDELDKILRDAYEAAEPDTKPATGVVAEALAFYGLSVICDLSEYTDPEDIEQARLKIIEINRAMSQLFKEKN